MTMLSERDARWLQKVLAESGEICHDPAEISVITSDRDIAGRAASLLRAPVRVTLSPVRWSTKLSGPLADEVLLALAEWADEHSE